MTHKLLSIVIVLSLIAILIVGRISPDDPLFYIISADPMVSGLRFLMAAGLLIVVFKKFFRRRAARTAVVAFGGTLALVGFSTLLLLPAGSAVYSYLLPMDQLLMVGTGAIFTSAAFDKRIKPIYRETEPAKIPVRATA